MANIQSFVPSLWSAELVQAFESQSIVHLVVKEIETNKIMAKINR